MHPDANRLITLGSPHQGLRATPLRARVDRKFPGCPEADRVDYVAGAGRLDPLGANASSFSSRSAARSYRQIMGEPDLQGDGLVPLSSALRRDARWIELADTAHGGLFGQSWYGSTDRIERWWSTRGWACRRGRWRARRGRARRHSQCRPRFRARTAGAGEGRRAARARGAPRGDAGVSISDPT